MPSPATAVARHARRVCAAVAVSAVLAACTSAPTPSVPTPGLAVPGDAVEPAPTPTATAEASTGPTPTPTVASPTPSPSPTTAAVAGPAPTTGATEPPSWYRQRRLDVTATGYPAPQEPPPEYVDRRIVTVDHLPPPPDDIFVWRSEPIPADLVERSTWREGCPTTLEALRYVTLAHWGFDGRVHTGELIMHEDVVDDIVEVFRVMHEQRFPVEQVGLLEPMDFHEFHRYGDDNLTAMYECRAVTGGSGWSQHAYGRAIDINPFHNPYLKDTADGRIVLPAYATAYLDRDRDVPGMINEGDAIVEAFDRLGWGWGGRFNTLKDWQHFSRSGG